MDKKIDIIIEMLIAIRQEQIKCRKETDVYNNELERINKILADERKIEN